MSNADAHRQIGTLYNEHHGWLATWLGHKLNCRNLGAELAQDTFLRLLTARLQWTTRDTLTAGIENLLDRYYLPAYSQLMRNSNNTSRLPASGAALSVSYHRRW